MLTPPIPSPRLAPQESLPPAPSATPFNVLADEALPFTHTEDVDLHPSRSSLDRVRWLASPSLLPLITDPTSHPESLAPPPLSSKPSHHSALLISVDEIGEAGWREGSEDGGRTARDSGCDVGSVDGGNGDGDSIGGAGSGDDLNGWRLASSDGASGSAASASSYKRGYPRVQLGVDREGLASLLAVGSQC